LNINPLARKAFAEFLGVAFFLTAIMGATSNPGTALAVPALATTLGLAILVTAGISGGHLNPAVSIYFYSRKQLSLTELFVYIVAQLLGAVLGTWVGLALWGQSMQIGTLSNVRTPSFMLGELVATGGLVWLVGRLASTNRGNIIPVAVGLWVMAAAVFTESGAEANPAVAFGLLFHGHSANETLMVILMQLLGMLFASIFVTIFAEPVAAAKVVAEVAKPAVARKPAAKKAPAKSTARKPAAKKTSK